MSKIENICNGLVETLEDGLNAIGKIGNTLLKPVTLATIGAAIFLHERYENNFVNPAQFNQILLDKTKINKDGVISFYGQTEAGHDTTLNFTMIDKFQGSHTHKNDPNIFIFSAYGDTLTHDQGAKLLQNLQFDAEFTLNNTIEGINLTSTTDPDTRLWGISFDDISNTELSTEGNLEKRAALVAKLNQLATTKEIQTGHKYVLAYNNHGKTDETQAQTAKKIEEYSNHGMVYPKGEIPKSAFYLKLVK